MPLPNYLQQTNKYCLNDNEINVIVELIDDADAAYEIVKDSLAKRKICSERQ